MTYDGRAVANFVLDQTDAEGVAVSPLALQKIVYFCHVWALVDLERPLIRHSFEAWEHGPVLQYLYREFKCAASDPIHFRARRLNPLTGFSETVPYEFDPAIFELLGRVIGFYSRLTPSVLVELTHAQGSPWHKVWYHGGNINPGMKIENGDIRRFYARIPNTLRLQ